MTAVTVLGAGAEHPIGAELVEGRVLVDGAGLHQALGWELKPEGMCRGDVCVPVRDEHGLRRGERVDLSVAAGLVGSSTLLADDVGVCAVSVPAGQRQAGLRGRVAPDFTFPDLDGELHSLEDHRDLKRLLVAFASW